MSDNVKHETFTLDSDTGLDDVVLSQGEYNRLKRYEMEHDLYRIVGVGSFILMLLMNAAWALMSA